MIGYMCVLTGDVMFTDAHKIKDFHELFYEVEAKNVPRSSDDIADFTIGGNKSAEETDGSACAGEYGMVPNLALASRYLDVEIQSKREFMSKMRLYLKRVKDYHERKAMEAGTDFDDTSFLRAHDEAFRNVFFPMFDDIHFYMGVSEDYDATLPMLVWKKKEGSGEKTPFFYFTKSGLYTEHY